MRNKLQTILFFLCCLPFMAQADETVTYLHHDVLGSIVGTSDNAGKLQKTEYLSYGTNNGVTTTESSELGYTGKPHFKDLGLSYYGSRWYDPDAGRFTGIDPVAWTKQYAVHSFNRYSYANNNPYKYVDPDGNAPKRLLIEVSVTAYNPQNVVSFEGGGSGYGSRLSLGKSYGNPVPKAIRGVTPPPKMSVAAKMRKDTGHIFDKKKRNKGHIAPTTESSKKRASKLFESVASNPKNKRPDLDVARADKQRAGIKHHTKDYRNGQVWTETRNGVIKDAGVNREGGTR